MRNSSMIANTGLKLTRTPNPRQQAARRRLVVFCAFLGLAVASGVFGAITGPRGGAEATAVTGPFSYFPSE